MNRRRLFAILAAVLLTVFGTVVLVAYVNSAERRAQEGADLVTVLVSTSEIDPGTPASELVGSQRIAAREIPASSRPEDAVTSMQDLGDQVTVDRVLEDMPIVERQFGNAVSGGGVGRGALEEGRELISLTLEAQRALGGQIAKGDQVGVMISLAGDAPQDETDESQGASCNGTTAMVLTGVPVAEVRGVDPETGEAGGGITVSFDVDQSEAEMLAFGAEYGRIWLTRQRDDGPPPNGRFQTCGNIYTNLQEQGS